MNSRLFRYLALASLALTLTACGKQSAENANEIVIKIASVAPLTGPQTHIGKDNDNGARMAIDEANAQGIMIEGKKARFVLISEDDAADPKTATSVAQKLVDQKVKGVIGHLNSGTTIPASKIYHDAGIPQISPSATAIPYTAQGFKSAFRLMSNDEQQGRVLGTYAATKLGAKRIVLIDDRTAYGQGLADEFEKAAKANGAEIVGREYTTDKSTDFTAILTSVKAKQPEIIFFGGMDPQGGPMAKQMKQLGLNAKLLGGDGIQTAQFIKLAADAGEGAIASLPGVPLETLPQGKAFIEKFTAKYGPIQLYAGYAYDAATAMIKAMQAANSADPAKYLPELAKINFTGVTGPVAFDAKGDIKSGAVTLYHIKDGKWEVLETVGGAAPSN